MRLSSADNPRIKRVVHLRKARDRRDQGVFVAEGCREVGRALGAGIRLQELYFSPELLGRDEGALMDMFPPLGGRTAGDDAPIFEVPAGLLRKMAYLDPPEGVIAVFEQPRRELGDFPADGAEKDLFLVAAGTEKPGNLGAMVRSAEAAGATGVLVADGEVDPFNPNAIRASTGAIFSTPVVAERSERILSFLRERGALVFAATPDATTPYTRVDLTGGCAIVLGAEDTGVSSLWRRAGEASGGLIAIPMRGKTVDSLNASSAAAVVLFEARRQRDSAG